MMATMQRAPRILIVYRSREGQTARIVERIGSVLRANGVLIDIETAADRPGANPMRYDAVVIGDSIHVGRHSASLRRWIRRHRSELEAVPVAVFQVSLTSATDDDRHRREAEQLLDDLLDGSGIRPVATGLFAGAVAYTRYGWFVRRLMRRIAAQDGHSTDMTADHEYTDWDDVDRFAIAAVAAVTSRPAVPGGLSIAT